MDSRERLVEMLQSTRKQLDKSELRVHRLRQQLTAERERVRELEGALRDLVGHPLRSGATVNRNG